MLTTLEHLRRLLEKTGALEGVACEPAVVPVLGVVGRGPSGDQGPEAILEIAPVVLSRPPIVAGLGANLTGPQKVSGALEDVGGRGQCSGSEEQSGGFVVVPVPLVELSRLAESPFLFENFGGTLPAAHRWVRLTVGVGIGRRDLVTGQPEDLSKLRAEGCAKYQDTKQRKGVEGDKLTRGERPARSNQHSDYSNLSVVVKRGYPVSKTRLR